MSRTYTCKQCSINPVAGRNYVCGQCRQETGSARSRAVRAPIEHIDENRKLASKSISGDREARKALVAKLGKFGADRVQKSVLDSAAGATLFQRLARGRR